MSDKGVSLLAPDSLVVTSNIDKAEWNYKPVLGFIQRRRFHMALELVGEKTHVERLLEIGYGSGVFMPSLAPLCEELYGIDVHASNAAVTEALDRRGIAARLSSGSVTGTPYEGAFFDRIVTVSALEFVDDLGAACLEMKRILKPQGELIVITPGYSALIDFGLKALTGADARKDFEGRRERILPTLRKHFDVLRSRAFPPLTPGALRLYTGLALHPKN